MSKLLDRFRYFKQKGETFADGHGQVMHSNRDWEDSYRQRWQFEPPRVSWRVFYL
ncbi:respiratory nitrate reductase 2 alpha chain [Escherichia coli H383]|nr:hypothetical protein [Escherichia coli]OSL57362.1 respiratory nitrate reductase 2 alpha chain [Escherichia coli H383]